ncbi:MAG: helix-turn-helix domain-containing protein [Chloroflexi bacterium]|nr:helix-turn-helix domain-containing protein [Chloroflexota bacterium]
MRQDDGQKPRGGVTNRRQVLEQIPEDPAVAYLELRRKTGLTGADLDEALAELEDLGVINTKKAANEVLYWKAASRPDKEWYSVEDAAKYLSVSKRTVQQLIRDGEMVAYRVGRGGHRRIRRTDLDGPMHREDQSGLVEPGGAEDQVLSELWDNEQDAAYDRI